PSIFKTLPPDWLQQFYNALLHLDQDAMLELIQQLPPTQGDLARALSQCVHNFDYELLLERIQQANV
ncbi:MAG: hypothetical protein VKJ09_02225, partial [Leptolyngbya sp.]|nr:hypothetical protein [Leptolyngbya sp.]